MAKTTATWILNESLPASHQNVYLSRGFIFKIFFSVTLILWIPFLIMWRLLLYGWPHQYICWNEITAYIVCALRDGNQRSFFLNQNKIFSVDIYFALKKNFATYMFDGYLDVWMDVLIDILILDIFLDNKINNFRGDVVWKMFPLFFVER